MFGHLVIQGLVPTCFVLLSLEGATQVIWKQRTQVYSDFLTYTIYVFIYVFLSVCMHTYVTCTCLDSSGNSKDNLWGFTQAIRLGSRNFHELSHSISSVKSSGEWSQWRRVKKSSDRSLLRNIKQCPTIACSLLFYIKLKTEFVFTQDTGDSL